jgi:hypothetical protein
MYKGFILAMKSSLMILNYHKLQIIFININLLLYLSPLPCENKSPHKGLYSYKHHNYSKIFKIKQAISILYNVRR